MAAAYEYMMQDTGYKMQDKELKNYESCIMDRAS